MGQAFLMGSGSSGELDNVINGILEEYYAYSEDISANTFVSFISESSYTKSAQITGLTARSYAGQALGQHTERDYYYNSGMGSTYFAFNTEITKISNDVVLLYIAAPYNDEDIYRGSNNSTTNTYMMYLIKFSGSTVSVVAQNAWANSYGRMKKINDNLYMYIYVSGYVYMVPIKISATAISAGSAVRGNYSSMSGTIDICPLSSTRYLAVCSYGSSSTNYIWGTLFNYNSSNNTITLVSETQSPALKSYSTYSSYGYHCRAVALSANLVAVMTGYSSSSQNVQIIPIYINGNTISYDANNITYFSNVINSGSNVEQAYKTSSNSFAVIMNDYGTNYISLYEYGVPNSGKPYTIKKQTISTNTSYRRRIKVTDNLYFYGDIYNNSLYGTFQDLRGEYAKYTPYTMIDGTTNSCQWIKKVLYFSDDNIVIFYLDTARKLKCKKLAIVDNAIQIKSDVFVLPATTNYPTSYNFGGDIAIEKTDTNKFVLLYINNTTMVTINYYYFNGSTLQIFGSDLLQSNYPSLSESYNSAIFDIIPINNNKNLMIFYSHTNTNTTSSRGVTVKIYNIAAGSFLLEKTVEIVTPNQSPSYYRRGRAVKLDENRVILFYSYNSSNYIYAMGLNYTSLLKAQDARVTGQILGITKTNCSTTSKGQVFQLSI